MNSAPRRRPPANVVRKHDSAGRPYFVDRVHGGRTTRAKWERDVGRRRRERDAWAVQQARADAEEQEQRERGKRGGSGGEVPGGGGGGGSEPGMGIDFDGVPDAWIDEDGNVWEPTPVEGEDDTP